MPTFLIEVEGSVAPDQDTHSFEIYSQHSNNFIQKDYTRIEDGERIHQKWEFYVPMFDKARRRFNSKAELREFAKSAGSQNAWMKKWFLLSAADLYQAQTSHTIDLIESELFSFPLGSLVQEQMPEQKIYLSKDDHPFIMLVTKQSCLGSDKKIDDGRVQHYQTNSFKEYAKKQWHKNRRPSQLLNLQDKVQLNETYLISNYSGCSTNEDNSLRMKIAAQRHWILTEDEELYNMYRNAKNIKVVKAFSAKDKTCKDILQDLSSLQKLVTSDDRLKSTGCWSCLPKDRRKAIWISLLVLGIVTALVLSAGVYGNFLPDSYFGLSQIGLEMIVGGASLVAIIVAAVIAYGCRLCVNKQRVINHEERSDIELTHRLAPESISASAIIQNERLVTGQNCHSGRSGDLVQNISVRSSTTFNL